MTRGRSTRPAGTWSRRGARKKVPAPLSCTLNTYLAWSAPGSPWRGHHSRSAKLALSGTPPRVMSADRSAEILCAETVIAQPAARARRGHQVFLRNEPWGSHQFSVLSCQFRCNPASSDRKLETDNSPVPNEPNEPAIGRQQPSSRRRPCPASPAKSQKLKANNSPAPNEPNWPPPTSSRFSPIIFSQKVLRIAGFSDTHPDPSEPHRLSFHPISPQYAVAAVADRTSDPCQTGEPR